LYIVIKLLTSANTFDTGGSGVSLLKHVYMYFTYASNVTIMIEIAFCKILRTLLSTWYSFKQNRFKVYVG